MSEPLETYEAFVAHALRSPEPIACLRARRADARVDADERTRLEAIDEDGFALSALLVAKLRFERLVQGSAAAARGFALDAAAFADAFRAYHATVPMPIAALPRDEARAFEAWAARESLRGR